MKDLRQFLKGMELETEQIDTIMAEVGKNFSTLKEERDSLKDKVKELEASNSDTATKLQNLDTLTNENKDLKAQLQMGDSNVKKEFSKFVRTEIMSKVNDKNDFESVLKEYKKENPQYFGDTVIKKVQSSPNLNGGEPQAPTTNSIMNDILRSAIN
jgi:peptidoglycan hydrolase CwlO-like protein